jgi:hypothetical protein
MMFPTVLRCAVVALAVVALTAIGEGAPADQGSTEGAEAPLNTWLMEGGCPARTGRTQTASVAGPLERGWEKRFKGEIEGEPLVGGSWAFVTAADGDARTLYVLDIRSGAVSAKKTFRTPTPLIPCLGVGVVVLRSAPNRVDAFRWRAPQLIPTWKVDSMPIDSLLLHGREVYVRSGGTVVRYDLGVLAPVWRAASNYRGRLALRGTSVFAMDYDERGNASLVTLTRDIGTPLKGTSTGYHKSGIPSAGADVRIVVGAHHAFVHHANPLETKDGSGANSSLYSMVDDRPIGLDPSLHNFLGDATEWNEGWLATIVEGTTRELFLATKLDGSGYVLAEQAARPELVTAPLLTSFARGVAYLHGVAADLDSRRIRWRSGLVPVGRMVPARDCVLAVQPGGRVVALRQVRGSTDAPRIVSAPETPVVGRAALRDGSVVAGPLRIDPAGNLVVDGKPPRSVPLADVLLAEDASGALLCAGTDADDLARGLDVFLESEVSQVWTAIARLVKETRDLALLRHVAAEAWSHDAAPTDVASLESRIRDLSQPGRLPKEDPALAKKVADREAELSARAGAFAWERAGKLPKDAPASLRADLLRRTLRSAPNHAEAAAQVRALLPEGIVPKEPFNALEWLDFAEAVSQAPVQILPPPRPDDPNLTQAMRTYGSMLTTWRRDLVAVQSRQLLLVTPVERPGALARCLSMGELVCTTLERIFAKGRRRRDSPAPLVLVLYGSEGEYRKVASDHRRGHDLSWSAGFYSPSEELSRMYLPEDDEGFARVMNVFAHELTHQWIDERCPLFGLSESHAASDTRPGAWVVEGFANLIEELSWDLRGRSWSRDPESESPGIVAAATPEQLTPWPKLLALSSVDYHELDREPKIEVPHLSQLGKHHLLSRLSFFYAQSTAIAQYLFFADDGAYREKLVDFVGAYYRGETVAPDAAFGMTAEELGSRAVAFARGKR